MKRLTGLWVSRLVIVGGVHGSVPGPGLRTSGPLGHDDLVDPEDGARGVGGVAQGPVLQQKQVVDLVFGRVEGQLVGRGWHGGVLEEKANIFLPLSEPGPNMRLSDTDYLALRS